MLRHVFFNGEFRHLKYAIERGRISYGCGQLHPRRINFASKFSLVAFVDANLFQRPLDLQTVNFVSEGKLFLVLYFVTQFLLYNVTIYIYIFFLFM